MNDNPTDNTLETAQQDDLEGKFIRSEINLFLLALTFLTRVPSPITLQFKQSYLNDSSRYFPLVGAFVGVTVAVICWLLWQIFPLSISILLSMIAGLLLTGAFHEDGLADCCDGFGGGWDKTQVLNIMKDSRIGTYGTVALIAILFTKYSSIFSLSMTPFSVFVAMVVGHTWSRLVAVGVMAVLDYVQEDELSKVKPLAKSISIPGLLFAIISTAPLLYFMNLEQTALVIVTMLIFLMLAAWYLKRRLGGYTGDCLGAVQQISEVLIYLTLLSTM